MTLGRLKVSVRFLLVLAIGLVLQASLAVTSLVSLQSLLTQDRIHEVKFLVESAYQVVSYFYDQSVRGTLTSDQARESARTAVRAMRYDGTNYFFIWDLHGSCVVHGGNPKLEGRTFLNSSDAMEDPLVSSMVYRLVAVAKSPAKEGVISYRFPKAGQTEPLEKIAYSRLFEPWGWSIGTGAYVGDIDDEFLALALSELGVAGVLILLGGLVTLVLGRDLSRALVRLSQRVAEVAKGELEGRVPEVGRADEVGTMARALLVLRDTSREVAELRLDQLTGLPTRKLLLDRLRQAKARSSRTGAYGAVILIDLDRFKTFNDTYGHDIGDLLLKEVATRLSCSTRECDTVARLGGDEFVLVAVDIGKQEDEAAAAAEKIGRKILAALNETYRLGAVTFISSASIGITLFNSDGVSVEDRLKQADLAMYRSKEGGRNMCRFFDPQMEALMNDRALLEKELRQALVDGQFELHYQPQVTSSNVLKGAEALVRWNHPVKGQISPGDFIPLAEETGLILPLGRWVLETACAQLAVWALTPETSALVLAVNVSARQIQQPDFVDQVTDLLVKTGADARRLKLELTESLLVRNVNDSIEKMASLKRSGIRFSLDDFGTGYSSLSYLKLLPLDQVKIDQSFVRDVLADPSDAEIARTILSLAKTLGLEVIAEGVETTDQRDFLARAGCNDFQGYLFGAPVSLGNFEALVRSGRFFLK